MNGKALYHKMQIFWRLKKKQSEVKKRFIGIKQMWPNLLVKVAREITESWLQLPSLIN